MAIVAVDVFVIIVISMAKKYKKTILYKITKACFIIKSFADTKGVVPC